MRGGRQREEREHGHHQHPHRDQGSRAGRRPPAFALASSTKVLAAWNPDPMPFIALMGLGFVIGVGGHIYKSRTAVATGIGMIFVATILLPLGLYLNDS